MKKNRYVLMSVLAVVLIVSMACSITSIAPTATASIAPSATTAPTKVEAVVATNTATSLPSPTEMPTEKPTEKPTEVEAAPTSTIAPSETAEATKPPADLLLVSSSIYKDTFGDYKIVGEVINGEDRALTEMELTVVAKDASGKTLLKDGSDNPKESDTFNPLLYTLAPGETSPFEYTLPSNSPKPAEFKVTVTGKNTGTAKRGKVEVQNAQLSPMSNDYYFISGELVNTSDQPVEIHSLAGSLLGKDKQVVSANNSYNVSGTLMPAGDPEKRDRTPFSIEIDDPGVKPEGWKTYLDADLTDPVTSYDLTVDISNHYFDESKMYHIVGTVTNKSKENLRVALVAGLYDKKGIALDALYSSSPVALAPNDVMPFDLSFFHNVDHNDAEAARIDHLTVQLDPAGTFPSMFEYVPLTSGDATTKKDGATWAVSGSVANTSNKQLSSITVIISVVDAKGKVAGVYVTYVFPTGDAVAPGAKLTYEGSVYLDPKADSSQFTVKTMIKGTVK